MQDNDFEGVSNVIKKPNFHKAWHVEHAVISTSAKRSGEILNISSAKPACGTLVGMTGEI